MTVAYRKNSVSKPPFKGWLDGASSAVLDSTSFRQITNWMIRFNRITPFFQSIHWLQTGDLAGAVLMAARTYTNAQGFLHTVLLTNQGWGEVKNDGSGGLITYNYEPQYPTISDSNLYSLAVYNGQLYFVNGLIPLSYHKGDGQIWASGPGTVDPNTGILTPGIPYATGDFPGSSFFLAAFADRLLAINTVEPYVLSAGSTNYPTRIRYSAVNNANEWDFTIDASAGVFQISDAEDALSGWVTINQTGFAFRKNGITAINSTGNPAEPFFVENFSVGPEGVGCFLPYTLSAYGTLACFIAQDDVYSFSGGGPSAIGGTAKKSIFRDLASASSTPFGQMIGSFGHFVDYLTYWLAIPQSNDSFTSLWIYHFDDTSWLNVIWPYGAMRCAAKVVMT